ncbi:MAG: hypothetical protein NEA02_13900 [Thermoanaerobaculia bacterium]|nr:hypothetical protein [Thermoanaerobaculia bacterium]
MKKRSAAVLAIAACLSGPVSAGPPPDPPGRQIRIIDLNSASTIKIDMSALVMIPPEPPPSKLEQALSAVADLRTSLEEFQKARPAYKRGLEGCATKSYTMQEMRAAGCADSDTFAVCSRKLLHACITTARRPVEKLREIALQAEAKVRGKVPDAVSLPEPPRP